MLQDRFPDHRQKEYSRVGDSSLSSERQLLHLKIIGFKVLIHATVFGGEFKDAIVRVSKTE